MCALKIVVPNDSYNGPFVRYSPVVSDGLKLWMFPGGLGFQPTKNHACGGNDASIIGNPVIKDGYAECRGGYDIFQTDVFDNSEMTAIAVTRGHKLYYDSDTDTGNAGGNLTMPTGSRSGFRLGYHKAPQGAANRTVIYLGDGNDLRSSHLSSEEVTGATSWSMVSGQIGPNGADVRDLTAGTKNSHSSINTHTVGTRPITVGGTPDVFEGKCDVAFFALYHRVLSDDEIGAIHEQVSKFLEVRAGIIV